MHGSYKKTIYHIFLNVPFLNDNKDMIDDHILCTDKYNRSVKDSNKHLLQQGKITSLSPKRALFIITTIFQKKKKKKQRERGKYFINIIRR